MCHNTSMKKYIFGVVVGVGMIMGNTSSVEAVGHSMTLSLTHTLVTYSFTETFLNRDVIIPVMASTSASHSPLTAAYQLTDANDALPNGVTALSAAILSTAPISDGGYATSAGQKTTYMLVVLVSHDADFDTSILSPRLTSLPFLTTTDGVIDGQSVKSY